MIKPTVGRVVLYKARGTMLYPGAGEDFQAAIICRVCSDSRVNLVVFDAVGKPMGMTSVLLVQPEDVVPASDYCTWMPYQVGQAAKTEALEKQLAAKEKS